MNLQMNDAILLINLIKTFAGLLGKLHDEDREVLTPEERLLLGAPDDAARARLVAAIEKAQEEGR